MPTLITISQEELERLRERPAKLAHEKAYLQLMIRLMNKVGAASGLDSTIESLLAGILDVIGGVNLELYYRIDDDLFLADVHGQRRRIEALHDDLVQRVFDTHEPFEEEHSFDDSRMFAPEFTKAYTWVYPLLVGPDLIGVLKMEGLTIGMRELHHQLPTFFNYAALVLKNEILGHTRLEQICTQLREANAALTNEIGTRLRVEDELRQSKRGLECRVLERTAELRDANERLQVELRERRRAEAALRASEERYRQLVDTLQEGIWVLDPDAVTTFVNPRMAKMLGYAVDEMLGRDLFSFMDASVVQTSKRLLERRRQGVAEQHDFEFVRKDGTRLYASLETSPLHDPAGRYQGAVAAVADITERKQAEEERKAHVHFLESLDRINRAIQQSGDVEQMLWDVVRITFSIFECDRAWLLYPCDPDAPTYRVPVEVTRPGYPGACELNLDVPMKPGADEVCRKLLAADGPVSFGRGGDYPLYQEVAEQFGVQSQIIMGIYPKTGAPWMFGMHQCAHPRVWTPEARSLFKEIARRIGDALSSARMHRELLQSEERFRALVTHAADAFYLLDDEGRLLDVNQSACDGLGYRREELLALNITDVDVEVEGRRHKRRFWNALRPGEPATFEGLHRRKDGSTFPVEVRLGRLELGGQRLMLGLARDISERKRAEQRNRHLAAVVDASDDAIIGKTLDGIVTSWNRGAERLYGFSESEMLGRPISLLVPPERKDELSDILIRIGAGQHTEHYETVRRRKDGRHIETSITVSPIADSAGRIVGASAIARDITERKRAERSIALLNFALNNVHESAFLIGEDGRFHYVNDESCRALGYRREELLGLSVAEVDPDFPPERWAGHWQDLMTRGSLILEGRHQAKDGRRIPVEISASYFEYNGCGYNLALVRDISERKRTQQELQQANELLRAVIEAAPTPIIGLDLDGNVCAVWNPAAERMLGWSAPEVMGRPLPTVGAERQTEFARFREQIRAGITIDGVEVRRQRRDGTPIDYGIYASPLHDSEGRVAGNVAVLVDITERKRAEERIAAQLREKELLLREIHHRVKNNMQVVSSLLDLQARQAGNERFSELLIASRGRIQTMGMVHERLYAAQDMARVDLRGYVQALVAEALSLYGVDPGQVQVRVNVAQWALAIATAIPCGLIVHELLSNALRHAFPAGRRGQVEISLLRTGGGTVELTVQDDGVGIPPDLDVNRTASLGLRLVQILAQDQLGGTVRVERENGTRVHVQFTEAPT